MLFFKRGKKMKLKCVSSLEKCFLHENIDDKPELKKGTMLKNELYHFCVCYQGASVWKEYANLTIESPIAEYVRVTRIEPVPVQHASYYGDDDYISHEPGLYPDLMLPLEPNGRLAIPKNLKSLMVEIDTKNEVPAGLYPITFRFIGIDENDHSKPPQITFNESITFEVEIIDACLPKQDLKYTQWFHCDSLKTHYETEAFDEKHWQIIENFAKMAKRYGVNMILTPIFTPPLDTYVGGERETIQLVGVSRNNGVYSFDFSLLGRWVEMCNRIGFEYFEIAHFFTQWGANCTPKIMATVDGEYKKIFGWETNAHTGEYEEFLKAFIPELLNYLKGLDGADKRCYFHISDEPRVQHLETYTKAKNIVAPLLKGYPIIDALSEIEFYSDGVVEKPVPSTDHIEPFVEADIPDLWCYYCVSQFREVSNRFIAMPSYRTRIIGTQFYKYNISGFLHWGYNFYYNQFSYAQVNPLLNTDGEYFACAGDTFSVYSGKKGMPLESIRLLVFYDALQDLSAFKLCEELYGRDFVMNIIEEDIKPITFKVYPRRADYLLNVREKINKAIKEKIG